jgi:hypothetical protein
MTRLYPRFPIAEGVAVALHLMRARNTAKFAVHLIWQRPELAASDGVGQCEGVTTEHVDLVEPEWDSRATPDIRRADPDGLAWPISD